MVKLIKSIRNSLLTQNDYKLHPLVDEARIQLTSEFNKYICIHMSNHMLRLMVLAAGSHCCYKANNHNNVSINTLPFASDALIIRYQLLADRMRVG